MILINFVLNCMLHSLLFNYTYNASFVHGLSFEPHIIVLL